MKDQIENLFFEFGFEKIMINDEVNLKLGNTYRKVTYVKSLGFVIEFAASLEEATKNLYEDGDSYPLELGGRLVGLIKEDILKYMIIAEK